MKVFLFIFCFMLIPSLVLPNSFDDLSNNSSLDKYDEIKSEWFSNQCRQLIEDLHLQQLKNCKLIKSKYNNAYVTINGDVYFTLSMMKLIHNKHQWAVILAHENAHLELKHYQQLADKIQNPDFFFPKKKYKKLREKVELEADHRAKTIVEKHGFNSNQVSYYLQRIESGKRDKRTSQKIKKDDANEIIDLELIESIAEIK